MDVKFENDDYRLQYSVGCSLVSVRIGSVALKAFAVAVMELAHAID